MTGREKGEARIVRRLLHRLDVAKVSELLGLSPKKVEQILAADDDSGTGTPRQPSSMQLLEK